MNIAGLLGRKFIIKQILNYVDKNFSTFKDWLNGNLDIPGLTEEQEAEIINNIGTDAIAVLRVALEGGDPEYPLSKRLLMEHILSWVQTISVAFIKSTKLPFISNETDEALDVAMISFIENDLRPYVQARF